MTGNHLLQPVPPREKVWAVVEEKVGLLNRKVNHAPLLPEIVQISPNQV